MPKLESSPVSLLGRTFSAPVDRHRMFYGTVGAILDLEDRTVLIPANVSADDFGGGFDMNTARFF